VSTLAIKPDGRRVRHPAAGRHDHHNSTKAMIITTAQKIVIYAYLDKHYVADHFYLQ